MSNKTQVLFFCTYIILCHYIIKICIISSTFAISTIWIVENSLSSTPFSKSLFPSHLQYQPSRTASHYSWESRYGRKYDLVWQLEMLQWIDRSWVQKKFQNPLVQGWICSWKKADQCGWFLLVIRKKKTSAVSCCA